MKLVVLLLFILSIYNCNPGYVKMTPEQIQRDYVKTQEMIESGEITFEGGDGSSREATPQEC